MRGRYRSGDLCGSITIQMERSFILSLRFFAALILAMVVGFVGSCNDNPGDSNNPDEPETVAKIEIRNQKTELWLEDSLQLSARFTTAAGKELTNREVQWFSDAPKILDVSEQGLLKAVDTGVATIIAAHENVTASLTFKVYTYDLVYESVIGDGPALFSLELNESATSRLLPGIEHFSYEPVASPDGNQLVYVSVDDSLKADLYLYDIQSQQSVRLTDSHDIDDMPYWGPDGKRFVFRSTMSLRSEDIITYNISDKLFTNLTPDLPGISVEDRQPAWSPDTAYIAYSSYAGGNMDLWLMDSDGKNKRRITDTDHYDTEAAWSPDSKLIMFRRNFVGESDFMTYDLETGEISRIVLPGYQRMPAWSPDGRWIAFVQHPTLQDRPEIYLMRPDGTGLKRITREEWNGGQNPTFRRRQ